MESKTINIKIKSDYNEYTGPRYSNQGASSGEEFYHRILNDSFAKAFQENKLLVVDLDDTAGYLSSFLDEAFGNLVYDFSLEIVKPRLKIISLIEPDWGEMIVNDVYRDWESRRISNNPPKKTEQHSEWFRYEKNQLVKRIWI
jgi:hypothetical protein